LEIPDCVYLDVDVGSLLLLWLIDIVLGLGEITVGGDRRDDACLLCILLFGCGSVNPCGWCGLTPSETLSLAAKWDSGGSSKTIS
jgi:hypothetical protein